jgi:RNA polymerase sigma factor (sigma-70 family)
VPSEGRATRVEAPVAPEAAATHALYERFAGQIYGYCLHQLGSREEAEDAVQSTFLNAFRGLGRGIVPESEQAWLFKIAQNVCLSRRRSSWRRGRIESPADFEVVQETSPAPHRRADELIGLQDVLEGMPENQRRSILLREWQGLSYREIAAELNLSQAAVETLIFRARRALAQGLETAPRERRSWRARLRPSVGLGNVATALKSLLGGSIALKAAGTAAVVAVGAGVAVGTIPQHHGVPGSRPAPAPAPVAGGTTAPVAGGTLATLVGAATASAAREVTAPPPPQTHVTRRGAALRHHARGGGSQSSASAPSAPAQSSSSVAPPSQSASASASVPASRPSSHGRGYAGTTHATGNGHGQGASRTQSPAPAAQAQRSGDHGHGVAHGQGHGQQQAPAPPAPSDPSANGNGNANGNGQAQGNGQAGGSSGQPSAGAPGQGDGNGNGTGH